jgi:lycopene cyclase domain-containing protein
MEGFSGMGAYEYLTLLALCLVVTAPLELVLRVGVYRQARRLGLTLLCVGAVFVVWDLVGAGLGHWDYNPDAIAGLYILGLPLEEYLFFVVVPLCGILAFEAVRTTIDDVGAWLRRRRGATR